MVFVRTKDGEAPRACEPGELLAPGGNVTLRAETEIAGDASGPFDRAAIAVERDGPLRDALAAAIPIPSLRGWPKLRLGVLAVAAVPLLMLLELDRELVSKGDATVGRFLVDLCLAGYVALELTRKTPRMPGIAAGALVAVGLRFALFASRLCGKNVHPAVWIAMALATVAACAVLARAPTRQRVALELLDKMGISRADAFAAKLPREVSSALTIGAVAAAAGLPLLLFAMRRAELGLFAQAVAFVVYAVAIPEFVRRALDRAAPRAAKLRPARIGFAIAAGLALTAALMSSEHHFFDVGAELARCTHKLDAEAERLLTAQAVEIARSIARERRSIALAVMTVAIVPLAEERIYRGLLMDVLVRRFGGAYGLFASSILFGLAHMGAYQTVLHQTVFLGIAFGIAWAEGGIVAAFIVHATWNLLRIT